MKLPSQVFFNEVGTNTASNDLHLYFYSLHHILQYILLFEFLFDDIVDELHIDEVVWNGLDIDVVNLLCLLKELCHIQVLICHVSLSFLSQLHHRSVIRILKTVLIFIRILNLFDECIHVLIIMFLVEWSKHMITGH